MYFVGIDISKYKHDCFITNEAGEVVKDAFTFDDNGTGFKQFFDALSALRDPKQISRIRIDRTSNETSKC